MKACRREIDRFVGRIHDPSFRVSGRLFGPNARVAAVQECALMLCEGRTLGLLPTLGATFAFRCGDTRHSPAGENPGRALPAQVVAQLDAQLDALAEVPGGTGRSGHAHLGALGHRAGVMAVLAYRLLKSTGRRVGEIASLHLDCLDLDEYGKDVLVYDNRTGSRTATRLG